jgi:hypothetical protein
MKCYHEVWPWKMPSNVGQPHGPWCKQPLKGAGKERERVRVREKEKEKEGRDCFFVVATQHALRYNCHSFSRPSRGMATRPQQRPYAPNRITCKPSSDLINNLLPISFLSLILSVCLLSLSLSLIYLLLCIGVLTGGSNSFARSVGWTGVRVS